MSRSDLHVIPFGQVILVKTLLKSEILFIFLMYMVGTCDMTLRSAWVMMPATSLCVIVGVINTYNDVLSIEDSKTIR